jgi:SAM-dependent methyltransferase
MELEGLRSSWERLGSVDPLWAVLSEPGRRDGGWERDVDAFMETGRRQIDAMLARLEQLGSTPTFGRALDFGCGVGRLTQALGDHFEEVTGVDIAESMVARARELDRHGGRCRYVVNTDPDLRSIATASMDFVHSSITLQHIPPPFGARYVGELVRVLRPGGTGVLQVPAAPIPRERYDLPDEAWRSAASIDRSSAPATLAPGERAVVRVTVRNDSPVVWRADQGDQDGRGWIRIGNHWLAPNGATVVPDDGRIELPHDVPPGGEATVDLAVHAPDAPGTAVLEADLVQEGVSWFADRLGTPDRVVVEVRPAAADPSAAAAPAAAGPAPARLTGAEIEMHVIPELEVLDVVNRAGGEVKALLPDQSCGTAWRSWTYLITRH